MCLVVAVAVWRLMQGPIELDRLAPSVEAGFARAFPGLTITMAGVRIGIDRDTHQLDLSVESVRLGLPGGETLATFPEMATSFGLGDLLRGRLAPTRLEVDRPVVRLDRDAAGVVTFRIGDPGGDAPFDLAAAFADPAFAALRRLRIRDATVIVDDALYGRNWQADHLDAAVERGDDGLAGDLSVAVAVGRNTAELHASYRYQPDRRKLDLDLAADGIEPASLASLVPSLAPLARVHVPVSGTIETQFDFDERKFEGLRADLGLGAGWLEADQFAGGRVDFTGGELHAVYAPEQAQLRLENLSLALGGGMNVRLDGEVDGITRGLVAGGLGAAHDLPARLRVRLTDAPVGALGRIWPLGFSPGGRRWVAANIHAGIVDEAAVRFDLRLDPAAAAAQVSGLRGRFRYRDLVVTYFPGLPPLQGVAGSATLGDREIDLAPSGGSVKGLKLGGGTVKISNFGAPVETLTVDIAVAGPLRDALEIIDNKPLRYAHAAGIDPAAVGGRAEAQLHFRLPLLADLKLDAVDYTAKAALSGVSIQKLALGRNLADGDFALELSRTGVQVKGDARIDATPAQIDAALAFAPKAGPRATYRLGIVLDEAERRRLGYDIAEDRLSGPVAVDLRYSQLDPARVAVTANFDLRRAAVAVAETGWKKPAGQPGTARISLDLDRKEIAGTPQVELHAAGLDGRLALGLGADRQHVERIEIRRLAIGNDDFAGTATRRKGGGWNADLRGARLDLRPLLKNALGKGAGPPPPLAVSARFDRVELDLAHPLLGVSADLLRDGGMWRSIRIDGHYANGRRLALRLAGGALSATSDDFGATVAFFDIADNVVGGRMTMSGQFAEAQGAPVLSAQIDARDFSLANASTAAKVLSLASLDGPVAMMRGSGIPFSRLHAGFGYRDGGIAVDKLVAAGGALGVTASGTLDLGADTLDISGTIAPAHTLNSAIGKVPVIGSLLMGGEGQSLFAANYRLSGPSAAPAVSVNPLSALAPGALRRLFDLPMSGPMPEQPR